MKKQLIVHSAAGSDSEIARWLWAIEDCRKRTLLSLDGLKAEELDWTPNEGGDNIGTILYHLAAIEADWLFSDVLQEDFSEEIDKLLTFDVRDEQGRLTSLKGVSLEKHLERLARVRLILLTVYREMKMNEFHRARDLSEYVVTPEWVLHHLMQHEAEHRGQILDLRLRANRTFSDLTTNLF